jgi:hypothetical protein
MVKCGVLFEVRTEFLKTFIQAINPKAFPPEGGVGLDLSVDAY